MFNFENINDMEQFREPLEQMEQLNDMAGDTRLSGFERISDGGNEYIAEYLRDFVPTEHLEGCSEIRYNPESRIFTENPYALGVYYTNTQKIEIASENRFESLDDLLDAIVHETGHNAYTYLEKSSPHIIERWEQIHEESKNFSDLDVGYGFVSEYAKSSCFEDFAESYRAYIRDPELLKFMNESKYEFMKYQVFEGREYLQNALAISREIPASHLEGLLSQDSVGDISSMSRESLLEAVGKSLYTDFLIYSPGLESEFLTLTGDNAGISAFSSLYSEYICNGDELLRKNPQQYNFMKDRIFHGIEYIQGRRDLMSKVSFDGVSKDEKSTISGCEQLDYYADVCIKLDIVAISPHHTKKRKDGGNVNELLNAGDGGDTLFLSGCAKKCVKCEVKSSSVVAY